jgi:Tol biopolymer transport system component
LISITAEDTLYLSGISAEWIDFSRDGAWVTYVSYPEGTLWRSRLDGSHRLRLTDAPMLTSMPRWSPDGKRIAFLAKKPGEEWRIYAVSADGGGLEPLVRDEISQFDATWSPDGNSIAFGESYFDTNSVVRMLDLRTRSISTLPGSEGLFSPRWSPDGRSLVALTHNLQNSQKMLLFSFATQKWEQVAAATYIGYPEWSRSAQYIHFVSSTSTADALLARILVSQHKQELLATVNLPRGRAAGELGQWTGLAPDDSPLLLHDTSIQEICALDVELP